jgi:colanic acid/amylovoran biosynthesis glycosyltransferase
VFRGLAVLHANQPPLDWTYTVLGDGPERAALKELSEAFGLADRVAFAGAQPFSAVQRYYGSAHVVVMPGIKEGWPKVIAEAWAHGAVPVVAAAGLAPWILRERDSGCLFEPTPEGLAAALKRLLQAPQRMERISARGPGLAAPLSLSAFRDRLLEVLQGAFELGQSGRP